MMLLLALGLLFCVGANTFLEAIEVVVKAASLVVIPIGVLVFCAVLASTP